MDKTVKVFNLNGEPVGKIRLPTVFKTPIRRDVIKRAVLAIQTSRFQPQGRDPLAGKRTSAESRGVGLGIARIPRIKGPRGTGAFAPGTVGGRLAHPPTAEKKIVKRIPKKEKRLALFSAIAATASKEVVTSRGHAVEGIPQIPLIVTDELESLKKTKDVEEALIKLGVLADLYRVRESVKVRAGKGKLRGRRLKHAVGPLIVVAEDKGIGEAAENLPGVEVVQTKELNAELLAPGSHPGRLTVWTVSAVETIGKMYSVEKEAA
ncbi:MAG: 50S ribosomal protein L4 [Candidatus Bathyarchaeia archaeon]